MKLTYLNELLIKAMEITESKCHEIDDDDPSLLILQNQGVIIQALVLLLNPKNQYGE